MGIVVNKKIKEVIIIIIIIVQIIKQVWIIIRFLRDTMKMKKRKVNNSNSNCSKIKMQTHQNF